MPTQKVEGSFLVKKRAAAFVRLKMVEPGTDELILHISRFEPEYSSALREDIDTLEPGEIRSVTIESETGGTPWRFVDVGERIGYGV